MTLPLLRPSIAIALTVGTLLAISIFDEIYVLNGTALNTRSILMQVYNTTFVEADFAHGTALAFLLAAVTAVLGAAVRAGVAEVDGVNASLGMRLLKALAVLGDHRLVGRPDRAGRHHEHLDPARGERDPDVTGCPASPR